MCADTIDLYAERKLVVAAFTDQSVPPVFAIFASARLLELWVRSEVNKLVGGKPGVDAGLHIAKDIGLLDGRQSLCAHFIRLLGNHARHKTPLPDELDRERCAQAVIGLANLVYPALPGRVGALPVRDADVAGLFGQLIDADRLALPGLVKRVHDTGTARMALGHASTDALRWPLVQRAIDIEDWQLADRLLRSRFEGTGDVWLDPIRREHGKVGPPSRLRALRLSRAGDSLGAVNFLRKELQCAGYLGDDNPTAREADFDWAESLSIFAGALGRLSDMSPAPEREAMRREVLAIYRRVFAAQPWNTYPGINVVQYLLQLGRKQEARSVAQELCTRIEAFQRRLAPRELPMWTAFTWSQARLVCGDRAAEQSLAMLQRKYADLPGPCGRAGRAFHRMQHLLA